MRARLLETPDATARPHAADGHGATASLRAISRTAHPAQGARVRLVFIIDQLRVLGGAERMLIEMVARLDSGRFAASVVTFDLNRDAAWVQQIPVPVVEIPVGKTVSLAGLRAALRLRRFLREEKVEIVQTFFETSDLWAAPIAWLSGCRCLLSSRRDMGVLRGRKHRLAYPFVDRLFRRVLTVSDEVRRFTISHSELPGERVETIYNGVDLPAIDSAAQAELPAPLAERVAPYSGTGPLVVAVANIRRIKGLDVLLEAFARLKEAQPQAKLLIAGRVLEPETMAELTALEQRLGLTGRVVFLGELAQPYALMRRCDVFVLPSRNEGFSNALIEAMACRLPVVATAVGGNAEAVIDGATGFIVPAEDPAALAARLQMLLANLDLARRMGERGRERVALEFSMDRMIDRLMSVYAACLEESA